MPRLRHLSLIAAAALAAVAMIQAQGAAPPAKSTKADTKTDPGFTNLFDGTDLTGWKVGTPTDAFHVVDGAIEAHGTTGSCGGCAHLFYDGPVHDHTFRDFDLRLDVMARAHSNGGIYIMTQYQESGFPTKGFEVQLNNSHTDRIRTGSLYHVMDLSYVPAKDDEWFPMEMIVSGQTIAIKVKNQEVVHWTQPPDWPGTYDFADRKIAPGTIAFQAHDPGSYTYYKNIRIKVKD